ncbi:MAG TPA: MarR family transcriptional regulator [Noviherbaspirillum sp.]|nr:MarR family transcriptional regulator [Noviherbaspirillum sp.]
MTVKTSKSTMNGKASCSAPEHEGFSDVDALQKLRIVVRAAQRHSARIEKQCGVSGAELWILKELSETPGLRVGEIANRLAIHQTTTSNLLDALVKRGYVVKMRDTGDQRVVRLTLSEQGAALIQRSPQPARGLLPDALRKMDQEKLADLNRGLHALLEMMDAVDETFALQPMPFSM